MKKYLNAQKWLVVIEYGYNSSQTYKSLKHPKIALDFLTRQLNDHFYSIKAYFVFFFFLLAGVSFSQSKKEQIEQLNYRVDSLNQVVSLKNNNISVQNTQIDSLNQIVVTESKINSENTNRIAQLLDTIVLLKSKLSSLNLDLSNSNSQLQNVKTDISEKEKQINSLKLSSQHKIDSLTNLSLNFQKENQRINKKN